MFSMMKLSSNIEYHSFVLKRISACVLAMPGRVAAGEVGVSAQVRREICVLSGAWSLCGRLLAAKVACLVLLRCRGKGEFTFAAASATDVCHASRMSTFLPACSAPSFVLLSLRCPFLRRPTCTRLCVGKN